MPSEGYLRFVPASDRSLLVYVDDVPSLLDKLEAATVPGVLNLHPAYRSILVVFDPFEWAHASLEQEIVRAASSGSPADRHEPRRFEIPVRYNGPDLEEVATMCALRTSEVIEVHASVEYTVAFLGFLPGFGYLSGLDERLQVPRLPAPRARVPKGSVAIAGRQAAVYPLDTPGGWRILGSSETEFFHPDRNPPALLRTGDRVRFVPVR